MNKRIAKSLLSQYPPIIEVRMPINSDMGVCNAVIKSLDSKLKGRMPEGTIIFVRMIEEEELVLNYITITTVLKDGHLIYNRVKRDLEALMQKSYATL